MRYWESTARQAFSCVSLAGCCRCGLSLDAVYHMQKLGAGRDNCLLGGECTIRAAGEWMATPFFAWRYYGREGVNEVLGRRRGDP
jgi:hypothetical protein